MSRNVSFKFHLIFYTIQRCLIGLLPVMKRGVFNTTRKQNARACSWKLKIHVGRKKTHFKIMLACFFDHKGIVHYEFIAQWQTVNQHYYLEVLTRLRESVRKKRPKFWPYKWIIHHDNAPAHEATAASSAQVRKFCFHWTIPGIELSRLIYIFLIPNMPRVGGTRDEMTGSNSDDWIC
jgi:hypothetical protein